MSNTLHRIRRVLKDLRPSERLVAAAVLQSPEAVLRESISVLAERVGVSEPTVLRFSRALGCRGYREFKLQLARDLGPVEAQQSVVVSQAVAAGDTVAEAAEKTFDSAIVALTRVRNALDPVALETAASAIVHAARVEIFGIGATATVAEDARHKLMRLIPNVSAMADPHVQAMTAAVLSEGDVVLAISKTGRSEEICSNVELARHTGATVIALTTPATPLSRLADIFLCVDVDEDTTQFTPMTSRLAQLAMVDALVVGVGLLSPPEVSEQLVRIKEALATRRRPA